MLEEFKNGFRRFAGEYTPNLILSENQILYISIVLGCTLKEKVGDFYVVLKFHLENRLDLTSDSASLSLTLNRPHITLLESVCI